VEKITQLGNRAESLRKRQRRCLQKLNERENAPKGRERWGERGIDKENGHFIKYCDR
jgi:hypothetical protein